MNLAHISIDNVRRNPELKDELKRVQEEIWGRMTESTRDAYFKFRGRQACIQKAMSKPLPGASADAFLKGSTKVDDVTVLEVRPIHLACLQAVESPLLQLAEQASESKEKKATKDFNEQEQWDICFIFTANPRDLRKLLKESGKDGIQKQSLEQIENWNAAKINIVILAIIEQFHRHIKTTVKFAGEVESQGDKSFFQALRESQSKPPE